MTLKKKTGLITEEKKLSEAFNNYYGNKVINICGLKSNILGNKGLTEKKEV